MKKRHLFMLVPAFMAALACACANEDLETGPEFSFVTPGDGTNPSGIKISSGNYSEIFSLETSGSWTITKPDDAGWLSVRPDHGEGSSTVYISASANTGTSARNAGLVFRCDDKEIYKVTIEQAADIPYLSVTADRKTIPAAGGDLTLTVDTNAGEWEYGISSLDGEWLSEKSRTGTALTLAAAQNAHFSGLTATVTVSIPENPELSQTVEITQNGFTADLLDIKFNNDGTASDVSPMQNKVEYIPGASLMTYWNDSYGRYAARFNNTPGDNPASGYYKVDYRNNTGFQSALADGHTLEILVMYDADADGAKEIKPLSSMQSGGTGFLITKADRGTELTFLPNLSSGGWQWTRSGVTPERGKYYHLVGVWDKDAGKSRIYVNGEMKAEIDAAGDFNFPNNPNCYWFGIGCDAGDNKAEAGWKGDIVLARIYDDPLPAASVSALWDEVKDCEPAGGGTIDLRDIFYLPAADVAHGSVFKVAGSGFENGDIIRLESLEDGSVSFECETVTSGKSVSFTIPSGLSSGTWRMVLLRGEAQCPVGTVEMTISDQPTLQNLPEIIAHRGFHTVNGASENSIASFEAAIGLGVYGSEADFYITTDGVVVSNHDPDINGTGIENSTYDDIKDITLSNGEKVATLDVYLDKIAGSDTKLVIEIKPHSTTANNERVVDAIIEDLTERGMMEKVDFISFNYAICQRIASKVPGVLVGYLNGDKDPWSVAADIRCIDYQMDVLRRHPQWIRDAHNRGMKVNVWTVNSTADMMEFMAMGVDYITTDRPDILKEMTERLSE